MRPRTAAQKLVLAALADRADDDGECFPSISWLAEKCKPMSERSVREALRELAGQGLVEKTDRRRRGDGTLGTWLYRLPLDLVIQRQPGDTGEIVQPGVSGPVTPGRQTSDTRPTRRDDHRDDHRSSTDVEDAGARRDDVWDALVSWLGHEPKTQTERRGWNRVVRELREAGATGESVTAAGRAYDAEWKGLERSPYALMKWWGRFLVEGDGTNVRAAVLSWARNVGVHLEAPGLDEELVSWAARGADDSTLQEARRIATTPIEKLAAGA